MDDGPSPTRHERAQRFLTEASRILASSLEWEATLDKVVHLAVPERADWCMVDLVRADGSMERVAIAHRDPADADLAQRIVRRYAVRPALPDGISRAVTAKETQLRRDVSPELLRKLARDDQHFADLQRMASRSFVVAPLLVRGEVIGTITWTSTTRDFDDEDVRIVEELARSAATAIDNARLFRAEHRARVRMTRMQEVTAAMSRARTAAEVAEVACRIGAEAMEAYSGAMWLLGTDGWLTLAGAWGTPAEFMEQFRRLDPAGDDPGAIVVRTAQPLWVETEADYERVSPTIYAKAKAAGRVAAFGAVPLFADGKACGMIVFGHAAPHVYDADDRAFYLALGEHSSQALERARLLDAERRANERLRLLARSSEILAGSNDVDETLVALARALVPGFADVVVVHMVEGDVLRPVAVEHRDPRHAQAIREMTLRTPTRITDPEGAGKVVATGETLFIPNVEAATRGRALDAYAKERRERTGVHATIVVPIASGKRPIGVIAFLLSEPGRTYEEPDREFAEEIGRRASDAIERTRLFQAAQEAARRAEAANRTKDEFLATVSHELRTPLNAITGWVQMLRAGTIAADRRDYAIEVIERNARAQEQLVSDLLDVSRVISGRLRLEVDRVDLVKVVGMALDAVRPSAQKKSIEIVTNLADVGEPLVGDPDRLQQIVWNLLTNAVKFTPDGGRVTITLAVSSPVVELVVADTGQGLRPELATEIFEPFRQGDASFSRKHGGLGLGLAITRTLVEMHGGTISARSDGEGKGATFIVRLPVARLRPEATPRVPALTKSSPPPRRDDGLAGTRILVVEDEPDSRELLLSLLEDRGAKVVGAASAGEALDQFEKLRPDLVVSDIGLPGEDGLTLIRRIRATADGARVPAAALTAFVRPEDRARTLAAGFDTHVPKPIDPADLVRTLKELLARPRE